MTASRARRMLLGLLTAALVLVLVAVVGVIAWSRTGVMTAEPGPWGDVVEDPRVTVADSETALILQPSETGPAETGLVFYPGGKVEPEAYAARLSPLVTEHGVTVVIARPTLNLALLDRRGLDTFTASAPEIGTWWVGGHSLGGVRACQVAPDADGLVLFAAYCANDLSTQDLPALSLSGSEDALSTPEDIAEHRGNLPEAATMLEIDGANHAGFGDYGAQRGDGTASLGDEEMDGEVAAALSEFVAQHT
ncbi:MAG: alpha/beta hydrolase [Actinomycetales bacterium]|nr:alpha/beta hydrolase [Actinomycetales bacterium]